MIRPAYKKDAPVLTDLSFASKRYWGYPEAYFQVWKNELTITPEYIEENDAFVYEEDAHVMGYYSILQLEDDIQFSGVTIEKGHWLEHMFLFPDFIGRGIGTRLFGHMQKQCEAKGVAELKILSDPNARGFYEKMGCRYQGEYPSSIAGRTTPLLSLSMMNR